MKRRHKTVVKALRLSIVKWKGIAGGTQEDRGLHNCPLCKLFNNPSIPKQSKCHGCPVWVETGQRFCNGTPYQIWDNFFRDSGLTARRTITEDTLKLAQSEIMFLKSLLEKEKRHGQR